MVGVHRHVHTHTHQQTQTVAHLPLVLEICRQAVVCHIREGTFLTCQRPAHCECHGCFLLEEVVVGSIAIIACSVFHITVACLGGFKSGSQGKEVVAERDVHVIHHVPALLVDTVKPCVRVVAGRHIGVVLAVAVVGFHYFYTWEGCIALAVVGIVECERCAQCVANVIAEAAVQLACKRIHIIHLLPVAAVEHHRVDAHTTVAHTHTRA